jgi:hypothetical protein
VRKIKPNYSAYRTGDSTVLCAPKESLDIEYVRDKVGGKITYTPVSLLSSKPKKTITGRKSGGNIVLLTWKEYTGTVFQRSVDENGIITYEPMEVKNDTRKNNGNTI